MLDFTAPWQFVSEFEKWIKFINELQQRAKLTIGELEEMAKNSKYLLMQPLTSTNNSRNHNSTKTESSSTPLMIIQNAPCILAGRRRLTVIASLTRRST